MADLKSSITKGIATINMKTNNMLEESKCRTYISTLEKEIEGLKQMAGDKLYQSFESGNFSVDGIESIMVEIQEKYKVISQQKEAIKQMQEQAQRILGSEQNNTVPQAGVIYCSSCGAQNQVGYKFCTKCGSPME